MTTRGVTARRVEEDLANAGVPPKGNQVPSQDNQVPSQQQAPVIPPPVTNGKIMSTFLTLAQDITTQAKVVATQSEVIVAQANKKVGPRAQQNASTTTFRTRDFIRMNSPILFVESE